MWPLCSRGKGVGGVKALVAGPLKKCLLCGFPKEAITFFIIVAQLNFDIHGAYTTSISSESVW